MPPVIISDTSCLILLDKIGELELLHKVFDTIIITQTIADEWNQPIPNWIRIENPTSHTQQLILETTLDKGEATAIALAIEKKNCLLIIDEMKGRRLARQLSIDITGTLGVLAEAKRMGLVSAVTPLLNNIQQTDFRLNEKLITEFLKQMGE